ncbi:MAG TPA: glycosyltransferase family 4 protein [Flavobacterium sp.]
MRIIYITDQIYLHGGAEKILIQKLNYWVDWYGYDVLLVTSQQQGRNPFFPMHKNVQWVDLGVNYTEGVSYFNPSNLKKFPGHINKLKKAIADFKPDAIFLISLGLIRYVLPFISGKYPVYNEYHTSYYKFCMNYDEFSPFQKLKKHLADTLIRFAEHYYTGIVFLNQAEYDYYKRPNGLIIPNFFDEIREPLAMPKRNSIITLGRLSDQKGYDLLIEAWKIADEMNTGWTLEIYGNGEDKEMLQRKISEHNLGHSLYLHPATDQVNEKLSESGFYVMSSRYETFPMVLLEAMSHSLAVVSFDCPTGPASMLAPDEDSFLVPNGDIHALASKMLELINDAPLRLRMGAAAYENVKKFSPQIVMEQWDLLIKSNCRQQN